MKSLKDPYYSEEEAVAQVGKGWESLVREVYAAKTGMGINVGIIQVKEKYGGLRVYTDYYHEQLEEVISDVGKRSFSVCEECGADGNLWLRRGTWYVTRCDAHKGNEAVLVKEPLD